MEPCKQCEKLRKAVTSLKIKYGHLREAIEKLRVCAKCYPDDEGIGCKTCMVKRWRDG